MIHKIIYVICDFFIFSYDFFFNFLTNFLKILISKTLYNYLKVFKKIHYKKNVQN